MTLTESRTTRLIRQSSQAVERVRVRIRWWHVAAFLSLLAAALAVTSVTVDLDTGEAAGAFLGSILSAFVRLRWQFLAVVLGLGTLHYLATAIAARAAAGLPLPLGETLLVQFAAAAANRLTPAGSGGSAVNARYFVRRGMKFPAAIGSIASLTVLGAVADVLVLGVLLAVGPLLHLGGSPHQFAVFVRHIEHMPGPLRSPWLWSALGAAALGVAGWALWRRRASAGPTLAGFAASWQPVRRLLASPRRLGTLLASSGATTLILAVAFVASDRMVPGQHTGASLGVVLVAFMLAAAAGVAVPVPAGLGSTEGALILALVGLGEPTTHATQVVMSFRVLTFWLPAVAGVFATRRLRSRGAF